MSMPKKSYDTIKSSCKDCGAEFVITPDEQRRFKQIGYELPKRCPDCRKIRKEARKAAEKAEQERIAKQEVIKRKKKLQEDEKALEALLPKLTYEKTELNNLHFDNPDKTLVVIGNGFDIIHGVKSSYLDFEKTIGKNSSLRYNMETYLDTGDLWYNLEESLGKLNYSMFLNQEVLDMWLDLFDAYDPDAQAADFFAAIETAISPTFDIPNELNQRFTKWLKTLKVESDDRPFSMLKGNYKVLSFNYTEFIEDLYGADPNNICYIHGCRKNRKKGQPDEIILGHKPGIEEEQWNKVDIRPIPFKNSYKRYIFDAAIDTAVREAQWYDESTIKDCDKIIKNHKDFFNQLTEIKHVFIVGHSLADVDYPYFEEIRKQSNSNTEWTIGYHSYDDLLRVKKLVEELDIKNVTIFRT